MRQGSKDLLHHGEMLPVIMSLEQGEAQVELEGDAANAPDVTRLTPSELQDHLGSSVVSGAHNLAVVLPVEGGAAEVNEPHLGVLHLPDVLPLQGRSCIILSMSNKKYQYQPQITYLLLPILKHGK